MGAGVKGFPESAHTPPPLLPAGRVLFLNAHNLSSSALSREAVTIYIERSGFKLIGNRSSLLPLNCCYNLNISRGNVLALFCVWDGILVKRKNSPYKGVVTLNVTSVVTLTSNKATVIDHLLCLTLELRYVCRCYLKTNFGLIKLSVPAKWHILFFFLFSLFMASPLELQLPAYTTVTSTSALSRICDPRCSLWQCWILNLSGGARDRTLILTDAMLGS